jgi:peptidoglycan/LPS O-acetylase OafA/YrhL
MRMKQLVVSALLLIAPLWVYAAFDSDATSIPEPATLALLGIGGAAALVARWRKRK